jgi:hypothetical protein
MEFVVLNTLATHVGAECSKSNAEVSISKGSTGKDEEKPD